LFFFTKLGSLNEPTCETRFDDDDGDDDDDDEEYCNLTWQGQETNRSTLVFLLRICHSPGLDQEDL